MNSGESFDEDKSDLSDSSSTDQQGADTRKDQNYKESKVSFDACINNVSIHLFISLFPLLLAFITVFISRLILRKKSE